MTQTLILIFWSAAALVLYTYAVFPAVVVLRGLLVRRRWVEDQGALVKGHGSRLNSDGSASRPATVDSRVSEEPDCPTVSLVIACHNEASVIDAKLRNVLDLDYPADRLEVLLASDGSTDGTEEIAARFDDPRVRVLPFPRRGKIATLNAAVPQATGDVLVFTDANSMFAPDALRALLRPLADPRVGGVAGNQVYSKAERAEASEESGEREGESRKPLTARGQALTPSLSGQGERTYWGLDRLLKQFESRAGNTISATGAIYAIRSRLFRPVPPGVTDDFFISTGVIEQGHRLVFVPEAVAVEPVAASGNREFARKVRVMTRGFRSLIERRELMNPLRYGFYAVQLVSHKLLRRLMVFPLAVLLGVSPLLWHAGTVYRAAAILQAAFYFCALLGLLAGRMQRFAEALSRRPESGAPPVGAAAERADRSRRNAITGAASRLRVALTIPYYFCLVNVAAAVAVFNTLSGRRIDRWQTGREQRQPKGAPA